MRPLFQNGFAAALGLCLSALVPVSGRAGPVEPPDPKSVLSPPPAESRFSLGLETAVLFKAVPNPLWSLAGNPVENPKHYQLATQIISGRYRMTGTGGPGPLRGNFEASANLIYSDIFRGPETFFGGFALGGRYTFVPRHWPVRPFAELRGGVGWTDARGTTTVLRHAQQQDLTFTYLLGAGLSYEVTPRWSVTLACVDQHLSNLYLASPNFGFDTVGAQLGVARRF